jgi:hypothetical protein
MLPESAQADLSPAEAASIPASPRAAFASDLAEQVARLLQAGDTETARVAHEALGRLLGTSVRAPSGDEVAADRAGGGAAISDGAAEPRRGDA